MRSDAQAVERDLGQPFFAWLAERESTGGRAIGAGGAMRLASPQTPEDAEALRQHAAAFIAERFPAPAGPDPLSVAGRAGYEAARDGFGGTTGAEAAHAGWTDGVRADAEAAGAPGDGDVEARAGTHRAAAEGDLAQRGTVRATRAELAKDAIRGGRSATADEVERPFAEHAAGDAPFIGEWLAGKLYGTARNAAPDEGGRSP